MRTDRLQAVFSLTTTGTDIYAAMTRLAIASLRQSNPGLAVVVACDNRSLAALKAAASPLLREADRWLDVDVPPGCATFRNRHVKTRLRELIDGRFLFLDSDLFIRGPVVGLFELDADVAAVPERSPASSQQPLSGTDADRHRHLPPVPVDPDHLRGIGEQSAPGIELPGRVKAGIKPGNVFQASGVRGGGRIHQGFQARRKASGPLCLGIRRAGAASFEQRFAFRSRVKPGVPPGERKLPACATLPARERKPRPTQRIDA